MSFKPLLFLIFLISASFPALAQYEEMRILQTPEEMKKFRELKISEQIIHKQEGSKETPYIHRFFDKEGRLVREVKGTNKKNFHYDWKNRIILIQDSVIVNNYYDRDEYDFEFSGYGLLEHSRFPFYNSSFAYNPEKRELTESTMMEHDAYRIRYFRFDEKKKLVEEEFYHHDKSKEKIRKLTLDTAGKIIREDIINFRKHGARDTVQVQHVYNNKNQLIRKVTEEVALVVPPAYEEEPLIPHTEKTSSIHAYRYDGRGNMTEESFAYADESFGYRIVYEYNDKDLKIKQENFDLQGDLQQTLVFKYKFRK